MARAMSGVESPLATRAAILISVGVSASQPDAAPDAVGAKPAVGSPDVPPGLHVLVQGNGLVQDGSGLILLAALRQHDSQVLQGSRQLDRRSWRPVVRDGVPERARIRPQQPAAPQAGCGRPRGRGLRRGLVLACLRRAPRDLPVAGSEREPDKVGQPLVGQGHLTFPPRHYLGQPHHGLTGFPALLERKRVCSEQKIPVLPVGEILDGQRQAFPEVMAGCGALLTPPDRDAADPGSPRRAPDAR